MSFMSQNRKSELNNFCKTHQKGKSVIFMKESLRREAFSQILILTVMTLYVILYEKSLSMLMAMLVHSQKLLSS